MLKKCKLILTAFLCFIMVGCSTDYITINKISDLSGKNVGIYTGSEYDMILSEYIDDAIPKYYNSYSDLILALKSGKIDAFLTDEPLAEEIIKENDGLKILSDKLTEDSYAFAINPNNSDLQEKINAVLFEMEENGKLDELKAKWMGNDDSKKELETYENNNNKTMKFGTVLGSAPFAYMKNNEIVGYDIDVIAYICNELGYNLEIVEMSFDGIIPALISGKIDVAGCSIIVTEERSEKVLFSIPNYTGGIVIMVRE